jgi:hypothetical protein
MQSLFDQPTPTTITDEAKNRPSTATGTGKATSLSIESQYLLIDLADRRIARTANILQIAAALIAIVYFIKQSLK